MLRLRRQTAVEEAGPQSVKLKPQGSEEQECRTLGNVMEPVGYSYPEATDALFASVVAVAWRHRGPAGEGGAASPDAFSADPPSSVGYSSERRTFS